MNSFKKVTQPAGWQIINIKKCTKWHVQKKKRIGRALKENIALQSATGLVLWLTYIDSHSYFICYCSVTVLERKKKTCDTWQLLTSSETCQYIVSEATKHLKSRTKIHRPTLAGDNLKRKHADYIIYQLYIKTSLWACSSLVLIGN